MRPQEGPTATVPSEPDTRAIPAASHPPGPPPAPPALEQLLARPAAERRREYRYRFGQSAVFGLPVLALQLWGTALGGREAPLWVAVFQALLAGWVVYVAAAGMLFEGLLLLPRRRVGGDLVVAALATGLYGLSVARLVRSLADRNPASPTLSHLQFHWTVLLLAAWSGLQWRRYARAPVPSETSP